MWTGAATSHHKTEVDSSQLPLWRKACQRCAYPPNRFDGSILPQYCELAAQERQMGRIGNGQMLPSK